MKSKTLLLVEAVTESTDFFHAIYPKSPNMECPLVARRITCSICAYSDNESKFLSIEHWAVNLGERCYDQE